MDEQDGYHVDTRKNKLLGVANTILLSLAAVPENNNVSEDELVAKAVRMANLLIDEVKNFKLD